MATNSVIDWRRWHTQNYWRLGQPDRLEMKKSGFRTGIDTKGTPFKRPEKPNNRASAPEPTFIKFMDLPPELRCRVYDLHFDWLADHLKPYTGGVITEEYPAPPITHVNNLTRKESFPLFEDRRTFVVGYCWHNPSPETPRPTLYRRPTTSLFSNIRNIRFDLEYTEEISSWASMRASCIISISKDAQSAKVGTISVEKIEGMIAPTEMLEKTREKIKEVIDKKILATGGFVFQTLDMLRFGQLWWEALGETRYRH